LTIQSDDPGNRLSASLAAELLDALRAVGGQAQVRAIVLSGGQNFCVGADLKERAALPVERWIEHHAVYEELALALHDVPQPTIAAVRGWALGGGAELALGCDIVVASSDARFGLPEALRGLVPGMGGPQLLRARLPRGLAAYLLLSGQPLAAPRARDLGLIDFVEQDPLAGALRVADEIAQASPTAARALRRLLQRPVEGYREAYAAELAAWREALAAGDAVEGAQAFAEKRPARFHDPE